MPEDAFQELLARAVTDDVLRHQLLDGPKPDWQLLGIAPEDGERLRSIDRQRLEIFSRAILTNRFGRIAESLPRTNLLLGERAHDLFAQFCRSHPPENKIHREGLAFASFLDSLLGEAPEPWYLPEVLSYEAHLLDLRFRFDGDYGDRGPEAVSSASSQEADLEALKKRIPRRLRHHRLLHLGCDIEPLLDHLASGTVPEDVEHQPCFLLAHIEPSGACGRIVLNPPLVGLYLSVDGVTPGAALPDRAAAWLEAPELAQDPEFRTSCLAALLELASRRVVSVGPAP